MKIQCACGAKYAFDISPGQAQPPVQFVCPACGLDASEFVNNLIREELGLAAPVSGQTAPPIELAPAPGATIAPAPVAVEAAPAILAPPPSPPRVRLHRGGEKPTEAAPTAGDQRYCLKHPG